MTSVPPPSRYAGVVPAAGASRRMGEPKGLLQIGGRSFVERVVEALLGGGCSHVLVVVEALDSLLTEAARKAGATVLENPHPGEGPITSLRIAIEALPDSCTGVAYLPLDHALVSSDDVAVLLEHASLHRAPITLPMHGDKRGHPAVFDSSVFGELLDPSLRGGARTVVHRHLDAARFIAFDSPSVITDIDTPEAYAEAVQLHTRESTT